MIRLDGDKVHIILQKSLIEDDIEKYRKEFTGYNFQKELKKKVVIDMATVTEVDFFGFQFMYFFIEYLKNTIGYSKEQIEIVNNDICAKFSEKIGFLKCG